MVEALVNYKAEYDASIAEMIKMHPPRSNHASKIGHPCEYLLTERRRHPEKMIPFSVATQKRLLEGNERHKLIPGWLVERGFEFKRSESNTGQKDFDKYQIGGVIDGYFKHRKEDTWRLTELKPMQEGFGYDKLNSLEDIRNSREWYRRAYYDQIQTYLILEEEEHGIIILEHCKDFKFFPVELDYGYAETLLQKAERINKHLAEETEAPKIEFDSRICGGCEMRLFCMPDMNLDATEITADPELEEWITERGKLEAAAKKFKEFDDKVKTRVKKAGAGNYVIGDYLAKCAERNKTAYDIPADQRAVIDNIKAKFSRQAVSLTVSIRKVAKDSKEARA